MNDSLRGLKTTATQLRDAQSERAAWRGTAREESRVHAATSPLFHGSRFVVADGPLEALKWGALVLMLLDQVNKF